MRLDHIAYRVKDRPAAIAFFKDAFGYSKQTEFELALEDGSKAACMAMEPPEKRPGYAFVQMLGAGSPGPADVEFHVAPEIFISSGPPGSLIDNWVNTWGRGVGGIHHLAYQVEDARAVAGEWKKKGFLFTTEDILSCENLSQIFTVPNPYTGIIYELIERRGQHGFCKENVAKLMGSTSKYSQGNE